LFWGNGGITWLRCLIVSFFIGGFHFRKFGRIQVGRRWGFLGIGSGSCRRFGSVWGIRWIVLSWNPSIYNVLGLVYFLCFFFLSTISDIPKWVHLFLFYSLRFMRLFLLFMIFLSFVLHLSHILCFPSLLRFNNISHINPIFLGRIDFIGWGSNLVFLGGKSKKILSLWISFSTSIIQIY